MNLWQNFKNNSTGSLSSPDQPSGGGLSKPSFMNTGSLASTSSYKPSSGIALFTKPIIDTAIKALGALSYGTRAATITSLTGAPGVKKGEIPKVGEISQAALLEIGSKTLAVAGEEARLGYTYGVSRPLTTSMFLYNPGTELAKGSGSTRPLGWLSDAWNSSEYISPGQEIVAGFGNRLSDMGLTQFGPDSEDSVSAQVNKAIKDRQHLQSFKNNVLGNVASGASDALFSWYLDPTVIGGRAAHVFRETRYINDVNKEAKIISDIQAGTGKAKQSSGLKAELEWITAQQGDSGYHAINERFGFANPKLASVLAETKTFDETATVWLASRGNIEAINKLTEEKASVMAAIQSQKNILGYESMSDHPIDVGINASRAELDDLIKQDTYLERALNGAYQNPIVKKARGHDLSLRLARTEGKSAKETRLAENRAAAAYGVDRSIFGTTFQRNDAMRPYTVWDRIAPEKVQQAGQVAYGQGRATGVFHIAGANATDGVVELQANLRSRELRNLFTPEEQMSISAQYASAASEADANLILMGFEEDAVKRMGMAYGFGESQSAYIAKTLLKEKNTTIEQIRRDKGSYIDHEGKAHTLRFLETQTPNTYIMHNWFEVRRAMRSVSGDGTFRVYESLGNRSLPMLATDIYDGFQQVWRPSVLFRLGYPVRNVSEGFLRILAVTNALVAGASVGAGVKNFAKNRALGATSRTLGLKTVGQQNASYINELDGIIARQLEIEGLTKEQINGIANDPVNFFDPKPTPKKLTLAQEYEMGILSNRQAVLEDLLASSTFKSNGKYRIGIENVSYKGVTYSGTFAGAAGRHLRDLSSARATTERTLTGPGGKKVKFSPSTVAIKPDDISYVPSLTNTVNAEFRNSKVAVQLLEGQKIDDVVKWLSHPTDRDAVYARRQLAISHADPMEIEQSVVTIADALDRYLPNVELQKIAAKRDLYDSDITKAIKSGSIEDWQPIHGKAIQDAFRPTNFTEHLAAGRDKVFNYIGSLPDDTLLRHPFVDVKYNQFMKQSIDNLKEQGIDHIDNATIENIARSARSYALTEVKRTLYTIERYNNASSYMRFVSPFFAAFENTGRTWVRFATAEPTIAAHGYQLLSSPVRAGVVVDGDGNPIEFKGQLPSKDWALQVQVPQNVANKIPGLAEHPTQRFSLKSLNVVFQGETPFTPGFGPLVQIPVSELVKSNENDLTKWLADMTLQNNRASSKFGSFDLIAPAWTRRVLSAYAGDNATDYTSDYAQITAVMIKEYKDAGKPVPNDILNITKKKTDSFYWLRALANLTLPASPQFALKPEFQFYVDRYRQYQEQGTVDGMTPGQRFRKEYPDYFALGISSSSNKTGVNASRTATQNAKNYGDALSSALNTPGVDPGIVGALINSPNDVKYDPYSAVWQTNTQVASGINLDFRSTKSVVDTVNQPYISMGWDDYIAKSNKLEAELKSRGITSITGKGAEDLLQWKRGYLDYMQENNPAWWNEYSSRDANSYNANAIALTKALADPTFSKANGSSSTWVAIDDYLNSRVKLLDELQRRRDSGGSGTLSSKSNSDLQDWYIGLASQTNDASPQASEIFNRFFDGEFGRVDQLTQ